VGCPTVENGVMYVGIKDVRESNYSDN